MSYRTTLALSAAIAVHASGAFAREHGFSPGEQIDLSLEYLGIRAGQAHIMVGRPEGRVWPVVCQARTDGLAGLLDIREHYVSYWDADARMPRGSDLAAVELGDRHRDTARFDRELGKATVSVVRKGRRSVRTYDVPANVHDLGSALLYLRTLPLSEGSHVELPIFTGDKVFSFTADVVGHESLVTPAGRFETVKVDAKATLAGKFSSNRDMFIWFSNDARHVPVRFTAEFAIGSVVATLTGYRPGGELAEVR